MTDLNELYRELLPQHDLDAQKRQGRATMLPDCSRGNAGEVPAVAARLPDQNGVMVQVLHDGR